VVAATPAGTPPADPALAIGGHLTCLPPFLSSLLEAEFLRVPGERPEEEREWVLLRWARSPKETEMFTPDIDYDPIEPATGHLLADLGIDVNAVRETLADDLARQCPEREVAETGSWREAREG